MANITEIHNKRRKRALRNRVGVLGTEARPRISVNRSNKFFYAQAIVDGVKSKTVSATKSAVNPTKESVKQLGSEFAKKLIAGGYDTCVYDRGSYSYLGRVASFADGLRSAGLKI